ncbi:secreted protein [Melampsora americana]|nr:secreted protein [Melampsora americana]
MRTSFLFFLLTIFSLFQSLIGNPSNLFKRDDQLISTSNSIKEIESKIWRCGMIQGGGFGCPRFGYSTSCFSYNCHGFPGGYHAALNGLNIACKGLYLKQIELKSQSDLKVSENQV